MGGDERPDTIAIEKLRLRTTPTEHEQAQLAEAAGWFRKSATEAKDPKAMYELATMLRYGQGVAKDITESLKWYKKASSLGHPASLCSLGSLHERGSGVEQNPTKAFELYEASAKAGYAGGQRNLGTLYARGVGTQKNLERAATWWARAGECTDEGEGLSLGMAYSQFRVARNSERKKLRLALMLTRRN